MTTIRKLDNGQEILTFADGKQVEVVRYIAKLKIKDGKFVTEVSKLFPEEPQENKKIKAYISKTVDYRIYEKTVESGPYFRLDYVNKYDHKDIMCIYIIKKWEDYLNLDLNPIFKMILYKDTYDYVAYPHEVCVDIFSKGLELAKATNPQ